MGDIPQPPSELKNNRSFQRVTILSAMHVEQGHVMVTPPGWWW